MENGKELKTKEREEKYGKDSDERKRERVIKGMCMEREEKEMKKGRKEKSTPMKRKKKQ